MLKKNLRMISGAPFIVDIITTIISFLFTCYLHYFIVTYFHLNNEINYIEHLILLPLIIVIWGILFEIYNRSLYLRYTSFSNEVNHSFMTVLTGVIIIYMLLYSFKAIHYSQSLISLFGVINFLFLVIEKYFLLNFLIYLRKRGLYRTSVLMVIDGQKSRGILDSILRNHDWGLDIVGFLDCNDYKIGSELLGAKILGKCQDLPDVLHKYFIEEVIFILSLSKLEEAKYLLKQCEIEGVQVRIIPDFFGDFFSFADVDVIHGLPIITHSAVPLKQFDFLLKRIIDIVLVLFLLIILSPLISIIAIILKLITIGPILQSETILGLNKKHFRNYKFKTYRRNSADNNKFINKFSDFLIKYRLDELPQLYNVLIGNMSLVGPKPLYLSEHIKYKNWQLKKLVLKPGLTCLWRFNNREDMKNFDDWILMDLQYINHWSLWLDFRILFKTIPLILTGKGA